jgi:hypothetical protein
VQQGATAAQWLGWTMNAQQRQQHAGNTSVIHHPARSAVSGRRVRRIAVALVLGLTFAQPVTAQTSVVNEPPAHQVFVPVVMVK